MKSRYPFATVTLFLTLFAFLAAGCGAAAPTATGWWQQKGVTDPTQAIHLAIGPAQDGTLVWRVGNLPLDHVGLTVIGSCTGWTGAGTSAHFTGDLATAFGAPSASGPSVAVDSKGSTLALTWRPKSAARQLITQGYLLGHPGTNLPQSTVLGAQVGASGKISADGKTLHLDFDAKYTDPATGKVLASDTVSGVTFTREASCNMAH